MTKFTGPLIVGALGTDATAAVVDSSGTATFTGMLNVTQEVRASSSATFGSRVRIGDAGSRGTAICAQRVTILSNHSAAAPATILLPSGSDIVDFRIDVEVPFAAGALVSAAAIRASIAAATNGVLFEMAVSASTVPYGSGRANVTTFTGSNMRNVQATVEAHVTVQALATALTVGQAMLTLFYVVN